MARMSGSSLSVAANGVSANVLAGLVDEIVTRWAALRLLAAGSATGLQVTLLAGKRSVVNDQAISRANRTPVLPDDMIATAVARPGERLILTFRNTTAGALTVDWIVDVEPLRR